MVAKNEVKIKMSVRMKIVVDDTLNRQVQQNTALIKDLLWLEVKETKIIAAVIFSSLIFSSLGQAQDIAPLLSNGPAGQAVYQTFLKDQDKRSNETHYLLGLIEHSALMFERNGQKGSGKDAAEILRFKLNQYKNMVRTAEDFIEKVASFSSHTKKSYRVILPDGKKLLLKDLLYAELHTLRGRTENEKQVP